MYEFTKGPGKPIPHGGTDLFTFSLTSGRRPIWMERTDQLSRSKSVGDDDRRPSFTPQTHHSGNSHPPIMADENARPAADSH